MSPNSPVPLAEALSKAILQRIEMFAGRLWYIADEDETKEEQAFRDAQFHVHLYGEGSQHREQLAKIEDFAEYSAFVAHVRNEWSPRYTTNPTQRFEDRARALKKESNPLKAVKKFQKLCDDLEPIANVIGEVASQKSDYEQMQMDLHRGK